MNERGNQGVHLVKLEKYSRALDEIYALRRQAAIEVAQLDQVLAFRGLPLAVRDMLTITRARLSQMANGASLYINSHDSYYGQQALVRVGASPTLVRSAWEREQAERIGSEGHA